MDNDDRPFAKYINPNPKPLVSDRLGKKLTKHVNKDQDRPFAKKEFIVKYKDPYISGQTCTKCNQRKDLSEFHKHKDKPNGRQAWCKECRSLYDRLTDSEKRLEKIFNDGI